MNHEQFWDLIERSRRGPVTLEQAAHLLEGHLKAMPPSDIEDFARIQSELMDAAYNWDLWGAAFIINGGCADDAFEYFRGWLLLQGQRIWERATADPESLAEVAVGGEGAECETVLYAAAAAYEAVAGRPLPTTATFPDEPKGSSWEEEELATRFPALWRRFGPAAYAVRGGDAEGTDHYYVMSNPEADAQGAMHLAMAHMNSGHHDQAAELFAHAREHAPREFTRLIATNNLAWTKLLSDDVHAWTEALPLAEEATRTELPADEARGHLRGTLALALIMNGRDGEGLEIINDLVADGGRDNRLLATRLCIQVIGLSHLGDYASAAAALFRAVATDPGCALLGRATSIVGDNAPQSSAVVIGSDASSSRQDTGIIEEKLAALARCGFALKPEFGIDDLVESWGDGLNEPGWSMALICLGMEQEEPPFAPHCDTLWHFDNECIEDSGDYVRIAKRFDQMTAGSLQLTDITDRVDVQNGTAWLEFRCHGELVHIDCAVDDDWVDPGLFKHFVELLARHDPGKILISYDLKGQDCVIGCTTREQFASLRALIPEVAPLG